MTEAAISTPSPSSSSSENRLKHLDGLRALAALFVVVHHTFGAIYQFKTVPAALQFLCFGQYAVAVFLVLSGYSLSLATVRNGDRLRRGTRDFFQRRALRIIPPYLAALALSVCLSLVFIGSKTGTDWDLTLPLSWTSVGVHALLLQDWTNAGLPSPNYAFWSIAVEFHIYFLFPLFLWLSRLDGGEWKLLAFGLTCTALAGVEATFQEDFLQKDLRFIALFIFGMIAARAVHEFNNPRPWLFASVVLWVGVSAWSLEKGIDYITAHFWLADALIGVAAAMLLVALECDPRAQRLRFALSRKQLVLIGGFSYSLYLIHAPLIQVAWQLVIHPLGLTGVPALAVLLPITVPLCLFCAKLFAQVFEVPFTHGRIPPIIRRQRTP